MSMETVRAIGLKVGDQVLLAGPDTAWPIETRGVRVGTVSEVKQARLDPLFAEVRVTPEIELSRLSEVMVIARDQPAPNP
ncbi:MAG: rod shape-determining protein MreC [Tepidisphaeraceae bacterium]